MITKVLVVGATGSLAAFVIEALNQLNDVSLTLFARNSQRINTLSANNTVIQGNAMSYSDIKKAVVGQDIVYINLAGNLEIMAQNIIKAMHEAGVKRVIGISSIGIYDKPLKSVLVPYRRLADLLEESGLNYTILRPDWFTYADEIDYTITHKGEPEIGRAISRKSIAAFVASIVQNPALYINQNLGISKP